jgi:hypothetical protein
MGRCSATDYSGFQSLRHNMVTSLASFTIHNYNHDAIRRYDIRKREIFFKGTEKDVNLSVPKFCINILVILLSF